MRLSNKRSLVTGGAQGIGHAIAEKFGREGTIVYIADVNEETGAAAEAKLRETGTRATFLPLNVSLAWKIHEELAGADQAVEIV